MDDPLIPVNASREELMQNVIAAFGGPAFLRRGRRVGEAWELLLEKCRKNRREWLEGVRLHLGLLQALAGDWTRLAPLISSEEIEILHNLYLDLQPHLRVSIDPNPSPRALRRALQDLLESLERFNHRWAEFLEQLDLKPVNQAREDYNRFYVLEKECALRSPRLARMGFVPLKPISRAEIWEQFPLLAVFAVKEP